MPCPALTAAATNRNGQTVGKRSKTIHMDAKAKQPSPCLSLKLIDIGLNRAGLSQLCRFVPRCHPGQFSKWENDTGG